MKREKKFFECSCENEVLRVEKSPEYVEFAMYEHGSYVNHSQSFWARLKYAWWHIRTGKIYTDCMLIMPDKAKELGKFLIGEKNGKD